MTRDRGMRRLVGDQLGERGGVDLVDIAHALEEEFGVDLPNEQLARLGSYGDLLQLLRDTLAGDSTDTTDDALSTCFVRARVVTGGSDGRVSLVRVGWLTPDLAAAIADDVRQAPMGTWLQVLVPDDLTDAELASLLKWLRCLISSHVRLDVRRAADRMPDYMSPSATPDCDHMTQNPPIAANSQSDSAASCSPGTHLAASEEEHLQRCIHKRRSQ